MPSTAPIWAFPPSWGDGAFIETFSFLTSVMTDNLTGSEQRQAFRLTPRRLFEATYTVLSNERTQLDLMLQAIGSARWRIPLWMYAVLTSDLQAGDFSIDYDFRGRDIGPGTQLIIYGAGPNDYEVVTVGSLDVNGRAQLDANITKSWPSATVAPLREGQLTEQPVPTRINGFATNLQARFLLAGANPFAPAAPTLSYLGIPVLLGLNEDQGDGVRLGYRRQTYELDGKTGGTYRVDTAGRSVNLQSHNLVLQGPYAYGRLRDLIYTLRGQVGLVWLPTFADDFKLAKTVQAGSPIFTVEDVGYATYGTGNLDRSHVFIELNSGDRYCFAITGSATAGDGTEILALDGAIPVEVNPEDIYTFCFLTKMRSTTDDIEVVSVSGIDGTSTCALTFQSEQNLRVAATGGTQSRAPELFGDFAPTALGSQPYVASMEILYGDGQFSLHNKTGLLSGSLPKGITLKLDVLGHLILSGAALTYGDFTFVPAVDTADGQMAQASIQHLHVTTPTLRRYWRLFIAAHENPAQLIMVRSVVLQAYIDGPALTKDADTYTHAIASSYYNNSTPDKAFRLDYPPNQNSQNPHLPPVDDDPVNLGQLGDSWAASGASAWVGYVFDTAVDVNAMELWVGDPDDFPGNGPTELRLQYSSDGIAWADKKVWTGLSGWDTTPWRKLNVL